jgi:hypothetical protein
MRASEPEFDIVTRATKQNGRPFYQSLKSPPNNLKHLFKFQNDLSIF